MARFTIYCHTNRVTGKKYVGQTKRSMASRWADHARDVLRHRGCPLLSAAIRKHGADAFDHEVLDVVTTQDGAAERVWIAKLGCRRPNGYNLDEGGRGRGELDPSTIRKLSRTRWDNSSNEERERYRVRATELWGSLTQEQKKQKLLAMRAGSRAAWRESPEVMRRANEASRARPKAVRVSDAQRAWDGRSEASKNAFLGGSTFEERSSRGKRVADSWTPEQRSRVATGQKLGGSASSKRLTSEEQTRRVNKGYGGTTLDQRRERMKCAIEASNSAGGRLAKSNAMKEWWSRDTTEVRLRKEKLRRQAKKASEARWSEAEAE